MTDTLRSSVTHYFDHIRDMPWMESLFAEHGVAAVLLECADVLAGQKVDEVHEVTTFLRDVGIGGIVNDELVTSIRKLMPNSVLPVLRPLLRAPALQVRMEAIYTIGKLTFPSEAEALVDVFPAYLDKDPFCLARLLLELGWLGDRDGVHACMERIIAHDSYLVRWSALGYLAIWSPSSGPELQSKTQWLGTLSVDPALRVAGEARHQLAELELDVAESEVESPSPEWRQKRLALEKVEPAIMFSTLEIAFLNEMTRTGRADYTLEELAAFVDALEQPPAQ